LYEEFEVLFWSKIDDSFLVNSNNSFVSQQNPQNNSPQAASSCFERTEPRFWFQDLLANILPHLFLCECVAGNGRGMEKREN